MFSENLGWLPFPWYYVFVIAKPILIMLAILLGFYLYRKNNRIAGFFMLTAKNCWPREIWGKCHVIFLCLSFILILNCFFCPKCEKPPAYGIWLIPWKDSQNIIRVKYSTEQLSVNWLRLENFMMNNRGVQIFGWNTLFFW